MVFGYQDIGADRVSKVCFCFLTSVAAYKRVDSSIFVFICKRIHLVPVPVSEGKPKLQPNASRLDDVPNRYSSAYRILGTHLGPFTFRCAGSSEARPCARRQTPERFLRRSFRFVHSRFRFEPAVSLCVSLRFKRIVIAFHPETNTGQIIAAREAEQPGLLGVATVFFCFLLLLVARVLWRLRTTFAASVSGRAQHRPGPRVRASTLAPTNVDDSREHRRRRTARLPEREGASIGGVYNFR